VRRVLKDDGTCWINLGDSYNAAGRAGHGTRIGYKQGTNRASANGSDANRPTAPELKEKDLVGIPWRVAFALQADGWYLRQDIIWHKPNPMPESVRDRCTKAHEYIFLLSKSPRYFYDAEEMREEAIHSGRVVKASDPASAKNGQKGKFGATALGFTQHDTAVGETRNRRDVWTVATKPYPEAHFATFPPDLIRPCVRAGCPVGGTVLDPFAGAGTTGLVALEEGRDFLGIELNPDYVALAEERLAPLLAVRTLDQFQEVTV
jgi:DNA modification methylase